MRTVPFTSVLAAVFGVLRVETPTTQQKADALAAINLHIETGWKYDFWPELTPAEQRAFRATWDEETQFDAGEIVYFADDGLYYEANSAPNNPQDGESPAAYPAKWTVRALTEFRLYIALDQVGETPIDEVEGLYRTDPRRRGARPAKIDFTLSSEGIVPRSSCDALVWVQFRRRVSQFTLTAFVGANTYDEGDLVLGDNGECYRALTAVEASSELTDEILWELQPFPAFLQRFVVDMAKGDLLDGDGQDVKAARARSDAFDKLVQAHDQQFPGQGQFSETRVATY
jgi:hypothetical protein